MSRPLRRKLRRDLFRIKGSLTTLILIVAVGVTGLVSMLGTHRDLDRARHRYYEDYRLADLSVELKRAPRATLDALRDWPELRQVHGRIQVPVLIELDGVPMPVSGTALSLPFDRRPVPSDILLRRGAGFSGPDADEAILIDAFAEANGLRPGDRVSVQLADRRRSLLVVGTAMSPEFVYMIPPAGGIVPDPSRFGVLYLPERMLARASDLDGAYNQLLARVHDNRPRALEPLLVRLAETLEPYGVTQTTPVHELGSVRFLRDELAGLKVSATAMPGLFLGIAALVLNLLIGRMVVQQRSVIGTLKALGYSGWAITRHYLGYGVLIGLSGGLTGVGLGMLAQGAFTDIYRQYYALPAVPVHRYPDLIGLGVGIAVLFAVLGTLKGVRHAARLQPAEAMRPPPPERGGRVLPERIGVVWRRLGFVEKMVVRAIFRNPFRSGVNVLASLVATALLVCTLSLVDSLDVLMRYHFEELAHHDLMVGLREPADAAADRELGQLDRVGVVEPQLGVPCELRRGSYKRRVGISGLPRGHRLYTPMDAHGARLVMPDQGLVLSRKLAELLDVRAGQTLRLRPLIGQRREVDALVAQLTEGFLGLTAYADLGYLSRLIGEEAVANTQLLTTVRGAPEQSVVDRLTEQPGVVAVERRARSLEALQAVLDETLGASLAALVLFAGLIAFGSVLNASLVSLSEREREVGTLRVLGYSPRQVTRIFAGESLLLGAVGVALGVAAGLGLTVLMARMYDTELYRFPVVITARSLLFSTGAVALFLVLAQLVVYRLVRRLDWLAVLNVKE